MKQGKNPCALGAKKMERDFVNYDVFIETLYKLG